MDHQFPAGRLAAPGGPKYPALRLLIDVELLDIILHPVHPMSYVSPKSIQHMPISCGENNAMFTTHDWEWFLSPIYGDDWGMVQMALFYPHYSFCIQKTS